MMKGVPIEDMQLMWRTHWFWRRIVTTRQERRSNHAPHMVNSVPVVALMVCGWSKSVKLPWMCRWWLPGVLENRHLLSRLEYRHLSPNCGCKHACGNCFLAMKRIRAHWC